MIATSREVNMNQSAENYIFYAAPKRCTTLIDIVSATIGRIATLTSWYVLDLPTVGSKFTQSACHSAAQTIDRYHTVYQLLPPQSAASQNYNLRRLSWRRGVVASGVRRMNEVNARRARLVPGWVTVFWRVYHFGM